MVPLRWDRDDRRPLIHHYCSEANQTQACRKPHRFLSQRQPRAGLCGIEMHGGRPCETCDNALGRNDVAIQLLDMEVGCRQAELGSDK
jgi:hypothetical protein